VAVTFLLVVGEAVAFQIMEKLSTEHLKDCMEPTMDKTSRLLNYIYPLICRAHPELHEYMERYENVFRIGRASEIYFCANVVFMDMLLPPLVFSICL
jgi:hypothetical protein